MASAPRKILRLPSMWAMTKPTSTRPVTAITTFLPTTVPHSTAAGLLDHLRRGFLAGAEPGRSAALPSSNCIAIGFLLCVSRTERMCHVLRADPLVELLRCEEAEPQGGLAQ